MWSIAFYCIGLFCDVGVDLGWSATLRFPSEASCKIHGARVLENAIPPAGMRVRFRCTPENHA